MKFAILVFFALLGMLSIATGGIVMIASLLGVDTLITTFTAFWIFASGVICEVATVSLFMIESKKRMDNSFEDVPPHSKDFNDPWNMQR